MGLLANPHFRSWLTRYAAQHEALHGDGPASPAGICDGCGDPLERPVSSTPFCIVCLAEQYGHDRAQATARIATALRAAIAEQAGVSPSDIREAVEDVLKDLEPVA